MVQQHPLPKNLPVLCCSHRRGRDRRGTIVALSAFVFVALLMVAGLSINLTQLSTTKTELRLASDAAAKAGAIVLGQTQDVAQARTAAQNIAARHRVNDKSMTIYNVDVKIGFSEKQPNGTFTFSENVEPYNSVRVFTSLGENARAGEGNFYLTGFLNPDTFTMTYNSTATRVDHDICLVVDRSGSMAWDMSDQEWSYPDSEELNEINEVNKSIIQRYFELPHPEDSRWAALTRSSEVFFEHLESLPVDVQSGLVSYSSNFEFGLYESNASTIHSQLTDNYSSLQTMMENVATKPLIGNTNIASGMQDAVQVLTGPQSRVTAKGTMVVLTDGRWNQGTDPVAVASAAAAANVTVHTITFSEQADQVTMAAVAQAGGGNHYHAPNEAALQAIFAEIAQTLPAVLTN
jgi:Ca-activated chloride channel homolog